MDRRAIQVLDPVQLHRIEAVHRGFLYQHLYAVGCLLLAPGAGVKAVRPEMDEDIEIELGDQYAYVQVKTRSGRLGTDDVDSVLERHRCLAEEHASGRRAGTPEFWILSNARPSRELERSLESATWPAGVHLRWPDCALPLPPYLPPPWRGTTDALQWCIQKAESVPLRSTSAETLVLKLAALVQQACTGDDRERAHAFIVDELPQLLEQIVVQLHDFPDPPDHYIPHESEPEFASDHPVRIITGITGSGKTAWASVSAMSHGGPCAYFDPTGIVESALAATLSRELAARFFPNTREGLGSILVPGRGGLDALRAVNHELARHDGRAVLVLDNAHRVTPPALVSLIGAMPDVRWILLAQPAREIGELEARLDVKPERLSGWSLDTIAGYLRDRDCATEVATVERLRTLTGGYPLYVRGMVDLARREYEMKVARLCDDLEAQTHDEMMPQELMLEQTCRALSSRAEALMALLSLSDVPLTRDEIRGIAAASLSATEQQTGSALRELSERGIVQRFGGRRALHDAFRVIAAGRAATMRREAVEAARSELVARVEASIEQERGFDLARRRLFIRLLPLVGRTHDLVALASDNSEMFQELGFFEDAAEALVQAADATDTGAHDRFWAYDALAFHSLESGDLPSSRCSVDAMESLAREFEIGPREQAALAIKRMILAGKDGDIELAARYFTEASESGKEQPLLLRILKYDYLVCLYDNGRYRDVETRALELVMDYYDVLGLDLPDVLGKNPEEIWPGIGHSPEALDALKRLADTLDLYGRAKAKLGEQPGLARLHAFKFYTMAIAVSSAMKVGQDVVDEMLGILWDPDAARKFIETALLPTVIDFKLADYLVPVRSQYAVVLAYCGEHEKALHEMAQLQAFATRDPAHARELQNQQRLIDRIKRGEVRLPGPPKQLPPTLAQPKRKVGRNEPCPCGSGKKYKRCCGR